jgi:hypothetical protein
MPTQILTNPSGDFGQSIIDLVIEEGSLQIVEPLRLFIENSRGAPNLRSPIQNLRPALIADIAHFMCISHGRHPGIIDHASSKILEECARDWLVDAIEGFIAERSLLNELTVCAGPITRQSGQEKITSILTHQHKSFEMLATSDRHGTAAGAAIAFVVDWHLNREIFEVCALNLNIEPRQCRLPSIEACKNLASELAISENIKRALLFGAQQLLAQQRGLWNLISARHRQMSAST